MRYSYTMLIKFIGFDHLINNMTSWNPAALRPIRVLIYSAFIGFPLESSRNGV